MTVTPLKVGDVIERRRNGVRYVVVGFTSRGKTRLRRELQGTEFTTWWSTVEEIASRYRWVGQ